METNNLVTTLYDIKDRCFVYSVMLTEASAGLSKLKVMFKLPAIFISIVLSVINSSKLNETDEINIINTVFNAFIALLIGIENTLQIDNKKQVFTSTKNKFEKLLSTIEKRLLDTSEPISVEFVQNIINDYEQIDDDLTFDISKSIQERAKKNFSGTRTLPMILGGEKVPHTQELSQIGNVQPVAQVQTVPQSVPQLQQIQVQPLQQVQPVQPLQPLKPLQQVQPVSQVQPVPQVQPLQQVQSLQQVQPVPQVQPVAQSVAQLQQIPVQSTLQHVEHVQSLPTLQEQEEVFDIDTIINTVL